MKDGNSFFLNADEEDFEDKEDAWKFLHSSL
jgi:hypothetical protein